MSHQHGMNYQEQALRSESNDWPEIMRRLQVESTVRLLHAAEGFCTESGEFMDALKKHIFYGKPLDHVNLAEELGDLFWYAAIAAQALGVTFEEIQAKNIAKLRKRYPEKFTQADAVNRDLAGERKILEGAIPTNAKPPTASADESKLCKAVDWFAGEMKAKLLAKARQGFTGWDKPDWIADGRCWRAIMEHANRLGQGQYNQAVDIANLAMFWAFVHRQLEGGPWTIGPDCGCGSPACGEVRQTKDNAR